MELSQQSRSLCWSHLLCRSRTEGPIGSQSVGAAASRSASWQERRTPAALCSYRAARAGWQTPATAGLGKSVCSLPPARLYPDGAGYREPSSGAGRPVPGRSAAELADRPRAALRPRGALARGCSPRGAPLRARRGGSGAGSEQSSPAAPGAETGAAPSAARRDPAGAWRGLGPSGLSIPPARPRPAAVGSAGLGRLRGTAGPERSRAGSPRPLSRARGRPEERCAAQCSPVPSLTKAPLCWPRNC